jgi:hypothetical protein
VARTPETVNIGLQELMLLLNYRFAAVNSERVGELGLQTHEELVADLNRQSRVVIKPSQLADLIHHMREAIFEKVRAPYELEYKVKNHNEIMKQLKHQAPHLFKANSAGEIVMVELEGKDV